jgi:putative tryptophan/tyrosine transport system substrate-binding protein
MRRRDFIRLVGSAAALPLAARAQQPTMPVIGFLGPGTAELDAYRARAFLQGLKDSGLVEGQHFTVEYRWAEGHYNRFPALAKDLVQRKVFMIATSGTPAALAAKAATTTIPIVFETAADPIRLGLVTSLNRPGGNITGVTQLADQVASKRLALLHELIPTAKVIGFLVNPTAPVLAEPQTREALSAARSLGLELHVLNASSESDFEAAFQELKRLRAHGLVIAGDAFFTSHSRELAKLAVQQGIPAVYQWREFAAAGGLMSYGSNIVDTHRLIGVLSGRILKGDKPADLPVQQASKFEFLLNLKTAKALGLEIAPTLLARVDEVIE